MTTNKQKRHLFLRGLYTNTMIGEPGGLGNQIEHHISHSENIHIVESHPVQYVICLQPTIIDLSLWKGSYAGLTGHNLNPHIKVTDTSIAFSYRDHEKNIIEHAYQPLSAWNIKQKLIPNEKQQAYWIGIIHNKSVSGISYYTLMHDDTIIPPTIDELLVSLITFQSQLPSLEESGL